MGNIKTHRVKFKHSLGTINDAVIQSLFIGAHRGGFSRATEGAASVVDLDGYVDDAESEWVLEQKLLFLL